MYPMYPKQFLTRLALILFSLLVLPGGVVMATDDSPTPHENPDLATQDFDGIAILGYYTQLLDNVLARAPTQVELLRDKAPFANIPEDLEESLNNFGNASVSIAWLVPEIEADLDNFNTLAMQFLLAEMEAQQQQTQAKLTHACKLLSVIEESAATAGEVLGVPSSEKDSPLVTAYEELQDNIDLLGKLLDLFQAMLEALSADFLQKFMQDLPEVSSQEPLSAILQRLLSPTDITLSIEPTTAFVGDWVNFKGKLASGDTGLADREVVLLLNGVPYFRHQTDSDGLYQGQLQIPYIYAPSLTLQALYYPQGNDIGVYLASKSTTTDIKVLFYTATLELQINGKCYPGLDTTLCGRFGYGDQPIPAQRNIEIYLDRKLLSQVSVIDSFEQKISLEPETALGEHSLLVVAPPQRRYAPVTSGITFTVAKALPIIDVSLPRVSIMPFAVNLKGHIYSELGPIEGAVVKVSFGSNEAQAVTSLDGLFSLKLETGMNFSLVGSRELLLTVNPAEPWNLQADLSSSIVAINPILIGIVVLALAVIITTLAKRLRYKSFRHVHAATGTTQGVLIGEGNDLMGTKISPLASSQEDKDLRQPIFRLYHRMLKLIQDFTSAVLKPNLTLREFTTQCAPLLGPGYKYMDQFTRLIERLLYSRHSPEPADLEKSRELGGLIEGLLKHDRT